MKISTESLEHNIRLLKSLIPGGCKFCAVVKADCYGHGLPLLEKIIERHTDIMAVARPAEAAELRSLGFNGTILLFATPCAFDDSTIAQLADMNVTMTVGIPEDLKRLRSALSGKVAQVHLKVDTGMGRSGIHHSLAQNMLEEVEGCKQIRLCGIYTHFASADRECKKDTHMQLENFKAITANFENRKDFLVHAANSAGIIDLPESHFNMVRAGISMYGYQASDEMHNKLPLKPIMRLVAPLMQIKTVPAQTRCGYGLTWQFDRDTTIGIVPIGYADGYPRCMSNRAVVKVDGAECPVRGRVSMDQIIIDLSQANSPTVGMEVEMISSRAEDKNSVENLAKLAETIPYEITCQLNNNKRIRKILTD